MKGRGRPIPRTMPGCSRGCPGEFPGNLPGNFPGIVVARKHQVRFSREGPGAAKSKDNAGMFPGMSRRIPRESSREFPGKSRGFPRNWPGERQGVFPGLPREIPGTSSSENTSPLRAPPAPTTQLDTFFANLGSVFRRGAKQGFETEMFRVQENLRFVEARCSFF